MFKYLDINNQKQSIVIKWVNVLKDLAIIPKYFKKALIKLIILDIL